MSGEGPLDRLALELPRQAHLLASLRAAVEVDDRYRWLELGCSLGSGGGDEHSDVDVGAGYVGIDGTGQLLDAAASLAAVVGEPIEAVVHRIDGWPEDVCRVAAQYDDGVQLDLVLMPAALRPGLPDRSIAVVDKDDLLSTPWTPESKRPPSAPVAREWLVLGWWALSDAAKYVARRSWFEAADSIAEARRRALQLWAAGAGVPYPMFGLTSLLDSPPFELPAGLEHTYSSPADPASVVSATVACAGLLEAGARAASVRLGLTLATPLAPIVRDRLAALGGRAGDRAVAGEAGAAPSDLG